MAEANRKSKQKRGNAGPIRPVSRPAAPTLTQKELDAALLKFARDASRQSMNSIIERGYVSVNDDLAEQFELAEARKAAQYAANTARQLAARPRPRPSASNYDDEEERPRKVAEASFESWEDELPFEANAADVVAPFIRDKKHSPASVLAKVVAENNHYIGVGEYTLVDVGATNSSEARAAKSVTLKYHGIAPAVLETDQPLPEGRGCTHTMQKCDCAIPGRKVYLFNHSSYYMDKKAYERLELGSRVIINEHDLKPGESVLSSTSKNAWLTKRTLDGEYVTYDNRGVLKFQNPEGPLVPNWWLEASREGKPGSRVVVYDVGPKPAPVQSWASIVWEFFMSFLSGKTEEVLLKHGVGDLNESQPKATPTKAHQRAQVLLMGVTTGGGVEEVTKSINRVARTLAHETGLDITESTEIVRATHEQVMKAQDHLYNVAHKTMVRADHRLFLRLKPWIRVVIIATTVSGMIGAYKQLGGLTGLALSQALAAIAVTATASLVAELKERYAVMKRTSA